MLSECTRCLSQCPKSAETACGAAPTSPRLRSAQGGSNFAFLRSVFFRLLQHGSATNKVETSFKYDGSHNLHNSSFISVPAEIMRPNESRRTDYAETSICLTSVSCAPAAKTHGIENDRHSRTSLVKTSIEINLILPSTLDKLV